VYPDSSVRRVLIFRTGSLGDTVIALPCFHQIARAFPKAERVLLTQIPVHSKFTAAMAVLANTGLVHGDMRYPGGTRNLGELLGTILAIRRFRPDVLVHLLPRLTLKEARRDRMFFRLAGVRRFVGSPADVVLRHRLDPATGLRESHASLLARSIAEIGDANVADLANWDLHLTAAEMDKAAEVLAPLDGMPLLVCGPGTKMQAKDWGVDNWRALLGRLNARHPAHGLVTIGTGEERELCDSAARGWVGSKVNLAGKLSPRESAAVIGRGRVFIGPDSGPMHLAASVGVPCACVFAARNYPGVWYPAGDRNQIVFHRTDCMGCFLETCVAMQKKCILSVTVDEMELAVESALDPLKAGNAALLPIVH